jgi:hypothetical protein
MPYNMLHLPLAISKYIESFLDKFDKIAYINTNFYLIKNKDIIKICGKNSIQITQYIISTINFNNIGICILIDIKITDYIVNSITNMNNLKNLCLIRSEITDDNIKLLSEHKCHQSISILKLSSCINLTNDCMKYIAKFTNLLQLDLSYSCKITEDGIAHLINHTSLISLNLSSFCAANDSLIHLIQIPNLKELIIKQIWVKADNVIHLLNNHKNICRIKDVCISGLYDITLLRNFKSVDISFNIAELHICCNTESTYSRMGITKCHYPKHVSHLIYS